MAIVLRRLLAGFIDLALLAVYSVLLFLFISPIAQSQSWFTNHALQSELIGSLLLTIPFGLYFVISEASPGPATLGKRLLKLRVVSVKNGKRVSMSQSIKRSVFKFIPWELAHFAIWNAFVFESALSSIAIGALALSYILVFIYIFGLFRKPNRPLYDRLAGTVVVIKKIGKNDQ